MKLHEATAEIENYYDKPLQATPLSFLEENGKFITAYRETKAKTLLVFTGTPDEEEARRFFRAYDRKIQRQIEKLRELKGTVIAPNIIVKTEMKTPQQLLALGDIDAYYQLETGTKGESTVLTLAADFENNLATWEAGFIMDTIYQFAQTYLTKGETEFFGLDHTGEFYTLNTTIEDFMAAGKAQGNTTPEERRKIKVALFPEDRKKKGLLEEVTFILDPSKDQSKPYFLTMKFIFATKVAGRIKKRSGLLRRGDTMEQPEVYSPEVFELKINANVFKYLQNREDLLEGKGAGKVGIGFTNIPSYLQIKIDRSLKRVEEKSISESMKERIVRNKERYRQATLHCIYKWETGKVNRKQSMFISYGELKELGFFSANTKKPERRNEILHDLCRILFDIAMEGEAFNGATKVHVKGSQIIIDLLPGISDGK